jgi:hypothetical protein
LRNVSIEIILLICTATFSTADVPLTPPTMKTSTTCPILRAAFCPEGGTRDPGFKESQTLPLDVITKTNIITTYTDTSLSHTHLFFCIVYN